MLKKVLAKLGIGKANGAKPGAAGSTLPTSARSKPVNELEIQQWLMTRIGALAQINPHDVDVNRPFAEFGMDSIQLFELSGDLEKFVGYKVSEIAAWDFPTIVKLSRHLSNPGSEVSVSSTVMVPEEGNW